MNPMLLNDILKEENPFKRGVQFQRLVQADYSMNSEEDGFYQEKEILFNSDLKRVKGNIGRMDMLIDDSKSGYVMIMEIKATFWDKIKPKNIKRNLWSHGRQLHRYVDKYLNNEKLNVGIALIYPSPPASQELKCYIEEISLEKYSFPTYWYSELISKK